MGIVVGKKVFNILDGRKLRVARESKKLSLQELAQKTGLVKQWLSKIESDWILRGKTHLIDKAAADRILKALKS